MIKTQNLLSPTDPAPSWKKSSSFFRERKRPLYVAFPLLQVILLGFIFFLLVFLFFPKDSLGSVCLSSLIGLATFVLGLGYVCFTLEFLAIRKDLKARERIERSILEYSWCRSAFPHELWKTVHRFLDSKDIIHSIKRDEDRNEIITPTPDIVLPEYGIRISFYGPQIPCIFNLYRQSPNRITIGIIKRMPGSKQFRKYLKKEIAGLVHRMPQENEFCKRCNSSSRSTCYGEDHDHAGECPAIVNRILAKVDPYKDEKTQKELIRRKEKYHGERLETVHEWASGRPFAGISKVYEKYFEEETLAPGTDGEKEPCEPAEQARGRENPSSSRTGEDLEPLMPLSKVLLLLFGGIMILMIAILSLVRNPGIEGFVVLLVFLPIGGFLVHGMIKELKLYLERTEKERMVSRKISSTG